jgi:hypothetical protein
MPLLMAPPSDTDVVTAPPTPNVAVAASGTGLGGGAAKRTAAPTKANITVLPVRTAFM